MSERYRLHGGMGSPYSMKMRAVLRYRRLPHDWVVVTRGAEVRQRHAGPQVIPILEFPGGACRVDSTPLILELEKLHTERSIVPADPVHAFLAFLLEDMADEWMTKIMFHYRWFRPEDQAYSSRQIVADNTPGLEGDDYEAAVMAVRNRQIKRMPLVGCTAENAPVIESCFFRILDTLRLISTRDRFLFGTRPSLADLGVFGQFKVLSEDHTPHLIMRSHQPRVYDWLRRLDDASGVDGEWYPEAEPTAAVLELLKLAGETYLPFMAANHQAFATGREQVKVTLMGRAYSQGRFRYQVKCLDALRKRLIELKKSVAKKEFARLKELLEATGCWSYLLPATT